MKKYLIHTILFATSMCPVSIMAQSGTVQPKIMVIPFTKEDEDIRTILEEDVNKRIVITKIKEAFDNRGFTTVDFTAKLKAAKERQLLSSDNQTDWKTQILQMSGADIYVQAEIEIIKSSQFNTTCNGYQTSVTLILTAFEISSGNSLSNKIGKSPTNCTTDIGILASKAVESVADDFLNVMQTKFTDIVENGVEIMVDFTLDQNATYTLDNEFGAEKMPLSFILDEWISAKALNNVYNPGHSSSYNVNYMLRQPLKDPVTGLNFNANKFYMELYKFLKTLNISSTKLITSNTILVTLK